MKGSIHWVVNWWVGQGMSYREHRLFRILCLPGFRFLHIDCLSRFLKCSEGLFVISQLFLWWYGTWLLPRHWAIVLLILVLGWCARALVFDGDLCSITLGHGPPAVERFSLFWTHLEWPRNIVVGDSMSYAEEVTYWDFDTGIFFSVPIHS